MRYGLYFVHILFVAIFFIVLISAHWANKDVYNTKYYTYKPRNSSMFFGFHLNYLSTMNLFVANKREETCWCQDRCISFPSDDVVGGFLFPCVPSPVSLPAVRRPALEEHEETFPADRHLSPDHGLPCSVHGAICHWFSDLVGG